MPNDQQQGDPDPKRTAEFLRLFSTHQPQIFAYILTLLPAWHDAEEVMQETSVVLWNSFGEFTRGTNFRAWARTVAFTQVLSFRKRQGHTPIPLSEKFIEAIAQETARLADPLEEQLQALAHCVEQLGPRDRELLRLCYEPGISTKEAADQLGQPAGTVYKALTRIRRALFKCIKRTLSAEGPA